MESIFIAHFMSTYRIYLAKHKISLTLEAYFYCSATLEGLIVATIII